MFPFEVDAEEDELVESTEEDSFAFPFAFAFAFEADDPDKEEEATGVAVPDPEVDPEAGTEVVPALETKGGVELGGAKASVLASNASSAAPSKAAGSAVMTGADPPPSTSDPSGRSADEEEGSC